MECRHGLERSWCSLCSGGYRMRRARAPEIPPDVWISPGGRMFHATPACEALNAGIEDAARGRGDGGFDAFAVSPYEAAHRYRRSLCARCFPSPEIVASFAALLDEPGRYRGSRG